MADPAAALPGLLFGGIDDVAELVDVAVDVVAAELLPLPPVLLPNETGVPCDQGPAPSGEDCCCNWATKPLSCSERTVERMENGVFFCETFYQG